MTTPRLTAAFCEGYAKHKLLPTRTVKASDLLEWASSFTGVRYKRGEHALAAQHLRALIKETEDGE